MTINFSPETTARMAVGAQLIGFFFNWGLFGVLCVQVYMYHVSFPNDPKWRKTLVYGLFSLELLQLVMLTRDAFVNFVFEMGTAKAFSSFLWSWFSVPILSAIVAMAVQSFFAWRVWVLSKSRLLPGVIVMLMLLQGSAGIATGIKIKGLLFANQDEAKAVALTWMIAAPVVDIVIAVSMTVLLVRSKGGMQDTNRILNGLIRLTIETGSATAFVAVVEAILFGIMPATNIYQVPAQTTAKVYSNTLLAALNSRSFIRRPITGVALTEQSEGGTNQGHSMSSAAPNSRGRDIDLTSPVRIAVFSESVTHDDSVDIPLDRMNADQKYPISRANIDPIHEV